MAGVTVATCESNEIGPSLRSAFIRHGILSLEAATSLTEPEVSSRAAGITAATPGGGDDLGLTAVSVQGAMYGIAQPLSTGEGLALVRRCFG
ncbi:hypothetical protein ACWD4O_27370 [Streptomyces sp. NPDC002623]